MEIIKEAVAKANAAYFNGAHALCKGSGRYMKFNAERGIYESVKCPCGLWDAHEHTSAVQGVRRSPHGG